MSTSPLRHDDVAQRVVEALGLDFADYALHPDAVYGPRTAAQRAFKEFIEYRLYTDLQRGWRVTMPNLEQTGLLRIDYESLREIAADTHLWADCPAALRDARPGEREDLVLQRQFVMPSFVVTDAGSGLADATPVRPVPQVG
ncbi:hypothetical protein [Rhodococcus rhodochrous]|uniref:hypothetical protein n=1 Tax=Rhodococcus rhodochrous TaxID=1829 RepID=UPI0024BAAC48|nr:hypothetical protein [Rhodococcus rhodochrous]MDJ0401771.1 hypothetical protein [Rhodococcus rhodochrous]